MSHAQAVDEVGLGRFTNAMSDKMMHKREQGWGGWEKEDECSIEKLKDLLKGQLTREQVDYVDIANYCMMIWNRENME
jgi:hypothetical protein